VALDEDSEDGDDDLVVGSAPVTLVFAQNCIADLWIILAFVFIFLH